MTYKLEDGVPIPERGRPPKGAPKYPFEKMEVGQSFFVPVDVAHIPTYRDRIRGAAFYYATKHPGKTFSTHVVEGGIRVWRTA